MRLRPQQNEHYYSTPTPEENNQRAKMSITIKMRPPVSSKKSSKNGLQSDLSDLNKLTRQSREVAHSTENILSSMTSTSTSGFSHYRASKDFGDFQIFTPVRPPPKMVDV